MINSSVVQRLADEADITRQLHLYARGCDRGDLEILKSVYHDDALEEHGIFSGSAIDFCSFAIDFTKQFQSVSHYISNAIIEFKDGVALCECFFQAVVVGLTENNGESSDLMMGGRYLDRFEKRSGEWRIAHRRACYDWFTSAPTSGDWTTPISRQWTLRGRADRNDPIYAFLAG